MSIVSTLTSKGQTTIPVGIRELLGLKPGDQIAYEITEDGVMLHPKKHYSFVDLAALLPKSGISATIEQMDQAIAQAVVERYERSLPKKKRKQ